METNYYVKQFNSFADILIKWRGYLEELQKQALSDKKSAIKLAELSDKKDLIHCEELKDDAFQKELKIIYRLIDREKKEYTNLSDNILKPANVSLFSFTDKVANHKKGLKKIFNSLFEINEELLVRIELLKKNLLAGKYKTEDQLLPSNNTESEVARMVAEKEAINSIDIADVKLTQIENKPIEESQTILDKTKVEIKKEDEIEINNQLNTSENKLNQIENKPTEESQTILDKTKLEIKKEDEVEINNQSKTSENLTQIENAEPVDENQDFDYEDEIKKLLGI